MTERDVVEPGHETDPLPDGEERLVPPAVSHITDRKESIHQEDPEGGQWDAPIDQFFRKEMSLVRQELAKMGALGYLERLDEFSYGNFPGRAVLFKSLNDIMTAFINCEGSCMGSYELWRARLGVCAKTVEEYMNRRLKDPRVADVCRAAQFICKKFHGLTQTPQYRKMTGVPEPAEQSIPGIAITMGNLARKAVSSEPDIEIRLSPFLVRDLERCHASLQDMDNATDDYRVAEEKFRSLATSLVDGLSNPERVALEISPLAKRFREILDAVSLFQQLKGTGSHNGIPDSTEVLPQKV